MNKLYINRFSTGGGDPGEQDFYVTVTYEPQYENGVCTAVRVICTGSTTLGGVYDQNGNNVSEDWSDSFPTNPVYAVYLRNMSETLTFHGRWNQEYTTTIEVTQIGSSEGGEWCIEYARCILSHYRKVSAYRCGYRWKTYCGNLV